MISEKIKQIFCRHQYRYMDTECLPLDKYWIYRCEKCGRVQTIWLWGLKYELETSTPSTVKLAYGYSKDTLWLPEYLTIDFGNKDVEYCSRVAAKLIDDYRKAGIDLKEYGRLKGHED